MPSEGVWTAVSGLGVKNRVELERVAEGQLCMGKAAMTGMETPDWVVSLTDRRDERRL